jgi:4-methyl-5(b-hydroxyethyl)-thiazole monophosphate biosynthesis
VHKEVIMTKQALVPIADGTEEIEAVCIIDTLRRANVDVTVACVGKDPITASRGVKILADTTIDQAAQATYDLIALPGGMPGATNLGQCEILIHMLQQQQQAGRLLAAICAAPAVVLKPHGLLEGVRATCYPTFQDRLDPSLLNREPVVVDGTVITAQGPGVAIAFALTLVERLFDVNKRKEVGSAMIAE